jgi:hypothetical protein
MARWIEPGYRRSTAAAGLALFLDRVSPLPFGRARFALLNTIQDESGITSLWAIFDATNENERRAVLVAAIDRPFAATELPSLDIIAKEDFAADLDALGVKLPAAGIEPLLGSVHGCVIPRFRNDTPFRTRDRACRRTFLSGSAVATQPSIKRGTSALPSLGDFLFGPRDRIADASPSEFLSSRRDFEPNGRRLLLPLRRGEIAPIFRLCGVVRP